MYSTFIFELLKLTPWHLGCDECLFIFFRGCSLWGDRTMTWISIGKIHNWYKMFFISMSFYDVTIYLPLYKRYKWPPLFKFGCTKKARVNVSILLPCHRCVLECVLFVVLPRFNNNTTNMFSLRIDYFPSFRINNVKCQRYFHS